MALSDKQIAQRLLKKGQGVAETNFPLEVRGILEEGTSTYNVVTPNDIWSEADNILTVPPVLLNEGESGVVKYYDKLLLEQNDGGTTVAFKSPNGELKDAISGKFGFGYNFKIYSNDGNTQIFSGDWLVDAESGVLIFYTIGNAEAIVSPANPPRITFYKYIGKKGLPDSSGAGFNIKDPVLLATTVEISDYDVDLSGFTSIPLEIDGVSGSTLNNNNRILIKNQINQIENGIYVVSGTTLLRVEPIVSVGDYVFVEGGNVNIASSWVLNNTDAIEKTEVISGENTQEWVLFSRSASFTAGDGLELTGQEFDVLYDVETINLNLQGELQVSSSIMNSIGSLETSLSGETTARISGDQSLEEALIEFSGATLDIETILGEGQLLGLVGGELTGVTNIQSELFVDINILSGLTSTLSSELTIIETQVSINIEDITSLQNDFNNFSGVTETTAGSGLTYDSISQSLNVNVDGVTIKIVGNTLIGPREWTQDTDIVTIIGISGSTGIMLDHEPITPVSAYVNGINYFVNPSTEPDPKRPFFYNQYPPQMGTEIWFDPITAGFDIESGTDTISIRYLMTEDFING